MYPIGSSKDAWNQSHDVGESLLSTAERARRRDARQQTCDSHVDFQGTHVIALGNLREVKLDAIRVDKNATDPTTYPIPGFDDGDFVRVLDQYSGTTKSGDSSSNDTNMRNHSIFLMWEFPDNCRLAVSSLVTRGVVAITS